MPESRISYIFSGVPLRIEASAEGVGIGVEGSCGSDYFTLCCPRAAFWLCRRLKPLSLPSTLHSTAQGAPR
jgi:hypothetical protein